MNMLDKAISYISPQWAFERAQYKLGINQLRNYDAAQNDRLNNDWVTANGSGEQVDKPYRDLIRKRAQALERNSDLAEGIVSAIERNVVGKGIKPQAKVRTKSGRELDEKTNKLIEKLWKSWAKPENCDATGQNDFYELQAMAIRRMYYDGESFFNKTTDKSQRIPFQLQMMEPEQMGSNSTEYQGNAIQSGVELTKTLKPVAYWFYHIDPFGFQTFEPYRIENNNMIHLFKKRRPTQIRGVSELARVMSKIHDTDSYLDAEMAAVRAAACFAAFVETDDGKTVGRTSTDSQGKQLNELRPGIVQYLRPGQKVSFAEPKRNAGTTKDYVEIQSRRASAGTGVSYDVVTRDIKGNFSAARQNMLEDRKTFEPLQEFLIKHFCQPVWEEFITSCVMAGLIPVPDFFSDPERYFDVAWITPGWTWIDPKKEVDASVIELKAGITTLAEVCGTQGKDWQEVLEQRALEQAYAKELGLDLEVDFVESSQNYSSYNEGENNDSTK